MEKQDSKEEYFYVIEILPDKEKTYYRIIEIYDNIKDAKTLYMCLENLNILFSTYGIISSFDVHKLHKPGIHNWEQFAEFDIKNGIVTLKEEK